MATPTTNDDTNTTTERPASTTAKLRESAAAARERAGSAYESARQSATRATQRTAEGLESHPVAAVVGGLAIGAVIAAMLPRTQGEAQAFGKIGKKLTDTAKDAADSVRESGKAKLGEFGLDTAREKLGALVGQGTAKD